jgi:glutathione S-transferase
MRARMALLISETSFELKEVNLAAKPPEMLAASPKGTVPVCILPDGRIIDESVDIMRWALSRNDPEAWLEGEDQTLLAANDGPFKFHLDCYKYATRFNACAYEHRAHALALLAPLEDRLSYRSHLCRDTRSLTDVALLPFIRQFAATDRPWFAAQPLPHVHRWLSAQLSSQLFIACMAR